MKKQMISIIPIFVMLLLLCVSNFTTQSVFNIPSGASYTYEVINSFWNITQGINTGEGSGFNFEGTSYNITTPILIKARLVNPDSVHYTVTVDSKTIEAEDNYLEIVSWLFFIQHPILQAQSLPHPWNQIEVEKGPWLFNLYFIEPITFSNAFIQLSNNTFVSEQFTEDEIIADKIEGHFDNSSSVAVFDWVMNIRYLDVALKIDFMGEFYLQLAFHKIHGNLMGYRVEMNYIGNFSSVSYSIDWKQQIEIVGYNLPNLYFKSELPVFISLEWIYIFLPITVAAVVYIKYKKNKQ